MTEEGLLSIERESMKQNGWDRSTREGRDMRRG